VKEVSDLSRKKKPTTDERLLRVVCDEMGLPQDIRVNDKQFRFCQLYIECLNATQAYQEAYGCSYEVAMTNSSRLLSNAQVKSCINWLIGQYSENIDITQGEIMSEIKSIALDKSVSAGTRLKALELLTKVKGMTTPEVEISMPVIKVTISDDDIPLLDDGNMIDGNFTDID
jgi:phage terminase small subunit